MGMGMKRADDIPKYPLERIEEAKHVMCQYLIMNKDAETPQDAIKMVESSSGYNHFSSYESIIETAAILRGYGRLTLVDEESDNDYQGDSIALYKNGDTYYFIQWGWGSCSGCDALQAANDATDIAEMVLDYSPTPIGGVEKVLSYLTNELQNNYSRELIIPLMNRFAKAHGLPQPTV